MKLGILFIFVVWNCGVDTAISYDDIKIIYYGSNTSDTTNYTQTNASSSSSVSTTYFDPTKKTVVITLGWNMMPNSETPQALINAYFVRRSEFNILYLDWSSFSKCMLARDIVARINPVASTALKILQGNTNFNASQATLVGAGFGSLVMATISRSLKSTNRLVVLESGNFYNLLNIFYKARSVVKPKANDATFVDTYHTNDDALGDFNVRGHVNFFINGGKTQPGCKPTRQDFFDAFVNNTLFNILTCSTQRAAKIFAESVNKPSSSPGFISMECSSNVKTFTNKTCTISSKASAGFYADVTTTNRDVSVAVNYYVETNANSTYSKN